MKKKTSPLVAVCLASVLARLFAEELPWQVDYGQALTEAKAAHRPVLLDFAASWCGPCRMMETTTFSDANVQKLMAGYTLVKIDIDRNQMLAARYKVQAIPTCIVLNEFAETVDRHTGYADATAFSHWLTSSATLENAHASAPASQLASDKLKQLAMSLESPDFVLRDKAVLSLLDLCCARPAADDPPTTPDPTVDAPSELGGDTGAKLAREELRGFVQRHGALAASYLNDRRLAVRILFTQLYAEKAGADFQFDPWASSSARTAAATKWAKQLDSH